MIALDLFRVTAISPHPDDLALSVGGLLSALHWSNPAATSQWSAVTVFTQSLYNPYMPQISGQQKITALRRQEDHNFLSSYGIKSVDLGLEDSSCIGVTDTEESTVELSKDSRREAVARSIHKVLDDLSPELLLMPATVGNHIDHRLAVSAVQDWNRRTCPVILYEDLPYASTFSLAKIDDLVLAAQGPSEKWYLEISVFWNEKLRRLAFYPSQLSQAEIASVNQHAKRLARGGMHERLWVPGTSHSRLPQEFLRNLGAFPAPK